MYVVQGPVFGTQCYVSGHLDEDGNNAERVCCLPKVAYLMKMDCNEMQIFFFFFLVFHTALIKSLYLTEARQVRT